MRRRGILAGAAFVLLLLIADATQAAVADYVGRRIIEIHFVVEGREVVDPSLDEVVETRVGTPLSMADVRETITHLFSLARFDDVRADAELRGDQVVLRYLLSPVHPVERIDFGGGVDASGIDTGALRRAIAERYPVVPSIGRADDVSRIIVDALREAGYLHARVTPRAVITHDPDRAVLVFAIDHGTRTLIDHADVSGVPAASQAEILRRLDVPPGAPYERAAINARMEKYVDSRRKRGYYEARMTASAQLAEEDRFANLQITMLDGPLVKVVFTGDPLPADKRADLVPVEREGSVNEDLLEDASNAIEDYLRGLGYRDAAAPHSREQGEGELRITFNVSRGPLYRVDRFEISGNAAVPLADFEPALRLRAGQPFSSANFDADVGTVEALYHRRGFANVRIQSAVEAEATPANGEVPVIVRIVVRENVKTVVESMRVAANTAAPEATLAAGLALRPGEPFFQALMALDRDTIQRRCQDLGYPSATVTANPGISSDGSRANIVYPVREGVKVLVDHVLIIGNVRTSSATIARELQFKAGDPLSLAAINESQRRLASLGLFRRTRISELRGSNDTRRDLIVAVEEAPTTTVGYGGGFEFARVPYSDNGVASQRFEFAPRASFEIGRRNLFGGNRSLNFFSSLAQRTSTNGTGYGFTEYRLLATYREPRVFGSSADAFVSAVQEQQRRASFNFNRRGLTAEIARRLTRTVRGSVSYQLQETHVFDELESASKPLIDRLFPQVRLSSFSSSFIRDTRSDPVDPAQGEYLAVNGQIAGRAIGSEVGMLKGFWTAQMFRPLRGSRIIFAGDARLGVATGFVRSVVSLDSTGAPVLGPDGEPLTVTVEDLPASERFFAGGDTTVRGFPIDTLGTPETIVNGFPIGGNGLVIFNGELRVPLRGGLGVVGFVDTGNVFAHATDITLGELRTTAGFGMRYKSPVGPIRVDVGFKLHREYIVPGQLESRAELHISLGQAF